MHDIREKKVTIRIIVSYGAYIVVSKTPQADNKVIIVSQKPVDSYHGIVRRRLQDENQSSDPCHRDTVGKERWRCPRSGA